MKKSISFWMLGIAAMLASCSQSDNPLADGNETVKVAFSMTTDGVKTRAGEGEGTPKLYVVEIYEAAENAAGTATKQEKITNSTGEFSLQLKKNTVYSFLFWACTNGDAYNTESLKAVTYAKPTAAACEAWCGELLNQAITEGTDPLKATLTHAVAKVVYHNSDALTTESNTLTVTYPSIQTFDVSTRTVTTTETTMTRAYVFTGDGANTDIATDYLFAPFNESAIQTLSVKLNDEEARDVPNVPLQANYVTTLKGAYSNSYISTITISKEDISDFRDTDKDF